jgi:hypothetical protein
MFFNNVTTTGLRQLQIFLLSIAEKPGIKYPPNGNQATQYQYDQSDPFDVSYNKRLFLSRFHDNCGRSGLQNTKDRTMKIAGS